AVVAELTRVAASLAGGEIDVALPDVADGHHLRVAVGQEGVEHLVAAVAQADEAQADALVGAKDAGRGQGRADTGRGGGLRELTAGEVWHGGSRRMRYYSVSQVARVRHKASGIRRILSLRQDLVDQPRSRL